MANIKELRLSWLTDEEIINLSFGEVKNSKTFNKNFEPEVDGLFCPQIFGPIKSNQFQNQDDNRRTFTSSKIRRWRMGHIALVSPVTNTLILKIIFPYIEKLLGVPNKKIKDLIYFDAYIVTDKGKSKILQNKQVLTSKIELDLINNVLDEIIQTKKLSSDTLKEAQELQTDLISQKEAKTGSRSDPEVIFLEDYLEFLRKHWKVKIETGSTALLELLKQIDLEIELKKNLSTDMRKFIQALLKNKISLTGIIWNYLPVIPAGLRPVVKLNDDTLANAQINNLYHKIIIANEKLKENLEINEKFQAPVLFLDIINSAKRKFQKNIDKLLFEENKNIHKKSNTVKNLLQILSGKEGILRKLCLGKRVDYSARSVISPGPDLAFNQAGIPVEIALVLFKPFLLSLLLKQGHDLEKAEQLLIENDPVIFPLLQQVIQNFPVLLNRAPTLHRLSIQGFQPVLTLEKTIQLHPLVTVAFNADFDGDQMAVHLPLTKNARIEIQERMMADSQILDPKNGSLIAMPVQDIILGIYYLTRFKNDSSTKIPRLYYKLSQIERDYEKNKLGFATPIIVPLPLTKKSFSLKENSQKFLITTFGRLKINQILPTSFPYYINDLKYYNKYQVSPAPEDISDLPLSNWQNKNASGWTKKDIVIFLSKLTRITNQKEMTEFLDRLKDLGFEVVTRSGISISLSELPEIPEKEVVFQQKWTEFHQIEQYYEQGFYSEEEFAQKKNSLWAQCKNDLEEKIVQTLKQKDDSSLYYLWDSGSRVNNENLTQIFGMRGNMTDYKGNLIETPIFSSLKKGLNPFEFFISTYGAMKGMMDTALKTAEAGYLTRQLVEAVQNIIITKQDCQTKEGIWLQELKESIAFGTSKNVLMNFEERIYGRYLAEDIIINSQKILSADTFLLTEEISLLQKNNVLAAKVRSPFTCSLVQGICQKCYGLDLSKDKEVVELGTAVGVIAAQSLGEPGTQLTMRTFYTGGVAGDEDITQGLPKVKEIFGKVLPTKKKQMILSRESGEISEIIENQKKQQITIKQKTSEQEISYTFDIEKKIKVKVGQVVQKGESLTSGRINLENLLEISGRDACQNHIKEEIWKVYHNQGIIINEKHIELFTRKMLGNVEITHPENSDYLVGDIVDYQEFCHTNQQIKEKKNQNESKNETVQPVVQAKFLVFNLKQVAKHSPSFLASIAFQDTLKNLVNYSIFQPVDRLQGIKENLIVGQLAPIGSGFEEYQELARKEKNHQK